MAFEEVGVLGGLSIRLAPKVPADDRYRRSYVPITPRSQVIPGTEAKVAPDTTVATWFIDDWSAGEGDLRWQDRDRYNKSDSVAPASDSSGLIPGPSEERTQGSAGDFTQFDAYDTSDAYNSNLYASGSVADSVYELNNTTNVWATFHTVGGAGGAVTALAASPSEEIFVSDGTDLYKVTSSTGAAHYATSNFDALGFFGTILYGLSDDSKLYSVSTASATTRTEVYDTLYGAASRENTPLPMSDVGPVFITPDGRVHEYNVGTDTGAVVGRLPAGTRHGRPYWTRDIYFVPYTTSGGLNVTLDSYIWFKTAAGEGTIGPLRSTTTGDDAFPRILGELGDRVIFTFTGSMWAYDLSDGAIVHLRTLDGSPPILLSPGIIHNASAYVFTYDSSYANPYCDRVTLYETTTDEGTLDTGRFDFGYLGLNKILTKVTVTTEQPLSVGDTIGVSYSTDGVAFSTLTGTMGNGEATKTWLASSSATTVLGVNFEWRLIVNAGSSSSDLKIISVTAEAVGAASRLEWLIAVDLSDSNLQKGHTVLEGLKTLKDNPAVQAFTDPWQQRIGEVPEQFDVTLEEVSLPFEQPGGERYAIVRLRSVESSPAAPPTATPEPETLAAVTYLTEDTTLPAGGVYIVDTSGGHVTITLPAISAVDTDGFEAIVIREGTGYVYLACAGADTYWDTTTQKTIFDDYGAASAVAHDTDDEWHELGRFRTVT